MKFKNFFFISFFCVFLSFLTSSCESSKSAKNQNDVLTNIKMELISIGNSSQIDISKKNTSILSKVKGDNEEGIKTNKTTSSETWKNLNAIVSQLDLDQFETWIGPTQERFYDGARATTITIEAEGKILISQPFDEGNPPAELKSLYELLDKELKQ